MFGLHVVTHVGNGDQETPARGGLLRPHGIVKVAGIFTVDGHKGEIAQIDAFLGFFRGRLIGQRLGFF